MLPAPLQVFGRWCLPAEGDHVMAGSKQQPEQAASRGLQAPGSAGEEGQKAGTWFQVGSCSLNILSSTPGAHIQIHRSCILGILLLALIIFMPCVPGAYEIALLCRRMRSYFCPVQSIHRAKPEVCPSNHDMGNVKVRPANSPQPACNHIILPMTRG